MDRITLSRTLPLLTEVTISHIRPTERAATLVSPASLPGVTWSSIDLPREEGETHFEPRCLTVVIPSLSAAFTAVRGADYGDISPKVRSGDDASILIPVVFRSHTSLPLSDAVDLLMGIDHTGLMAWEGSRQLLAWLAWVVFAPRQQQKCAPTAKNPSPSCTVKAATTVVELGAGCGFLSIALLALRAAAAAQHKQTLGHSSSSPLSFETRLSDRITNGDADFHVCITDGNDECVDLVKSNMKLYEELVEKMKHRGDQTTFTGDGNGGTNQKQAVGTATAETRVFWWGNEEAASDIVNHKHQGSELKADNLIIVAGDVVYGMEAVEPLCKAARDLATANQNKVLATPCSGAQAKSVCPSPSTYTAPQWVLSWMPRSLTRAQNLALFEALLSETQKVHGGDSNRKWVLTNVYQRIAEEEPLVAAAGQNKSSANDPRPTLVKLLPDPQRIVSASGAFDHATFSECTMDGCILCFNWE